MNEACPAVLSFHQRYQPLYHSVKYTLLATSAGGRTLGRRLQGGGFMWPRPHRPRGAKSQWSFLGRNACTHFYAHLSLPYPFPHLTLSYTHITHHMVACALGCIAPQTPFCLCSHERRRRASRPRRTLTHLSAAHMLDPPPALLSTCQDAQPFLISCAPRCLRSSLVAVGGVAAGVAARVAFATKKAVARGVAALVTAGKVAAGVAAADAAVVAADRLEEKHEVARMVAAFVAGPVAAPVASHE